MPSLILTFASDADLLRVVTALSVRHGYQAILDDGTANKQPPQEFVRLYLASVAASETAEHERNTAEAALTISTVAIS